MPDLDALNDPDLLADTPIGPLEVRVMWGQFVGVCHVGVAGKPGRCIHKLEPGQSVLNAIYGKRTFEQEPVRRMYAQQKAAEDASQAATVEHLHEEHRRAHAWMVKKYGKADLLEALAPGRR